MDHDLTLDIPRHLFRKDFAFSMDFGGSAVKILYTSEVDDKIRVHYATFPREKHEEAFSMLTEKCSGKLEPGTEVLICGLGGSEFQETLSQRLGLQMTNTNEVSRLMEGFMFMCKRLPWKDVIVETSRQSIAQAAHIVSQVKAFHNTSATEKYMTPSFTELGKFQASGDQEGPPRTVQFPVLMFIVGSGGGALKVEEDGSYEYCESGTVSGRTFSGLGSVLTGGKSFPEICQLASRGDPAQVDVHANSIKVTPDDDHYGNIEHLDLDGITAYSFGHAVGKHLDDFRPEDVSRSLISLFSDYFASRAYTWASIHQLKQVFFIGGFTCSNRLIQEEITKQFYLRKFEDYQNHSCDCFFLKFGQHCGSFGTLLMNLQETT